MRCFGSEKYQVKGEKLEETRIQHSVISDQCDAFYYKYSSGDCVMCRISRHYTVAAVLDHGYVSRSRPACVYFLQKAQSHI